MGATDPFVGRLVDQRYEVLSRVARGGMATVYLAVDRRLERQVALKVMHPHLAEDDAGTDFGARFRREARAAARLTHPGLVGVYDQGLDGETSYLTMEYVPGGNLRRRLRQLGSLSVAEALDVADAVLDALAAVHRAGLVHRDVKPENVLLADDGRVKLADFGLARAVTEVTATTSGTMMGTAAYLAPELVVDGYADARTDVYAVGILLYEMLTGRQPFVGDTPVQVAYQHVHSDVPAPSDLVAGLPSEVDELVGALAARQSDDRPVHAGAALELLRRTRAGLDPATLALRSAVEPTPEPGRAEDETTVLDGEELGRTRALPIGLVAQDVTVVPPPTRRRRWRRLVVVALGLVAVLGGGTWWWFAAGPGAYTTVPAVAGTTLADATALLDQHGLAVESSQANDPQVPVDAIVSSTPAGGERVRRGSTVEVVVSLGPVMVAVPDGLVGATKAAAEAALTAAGLQAAWGEAQYHDTAPVDSVLSASVDGAEAVPGAAVPENTPVTLVLSRGPAPVTLISVVNATVEQATADLARNALTLTTTQAYSDAVPEGQIISQDPPAGTVVHRGDPIAVVVSQGPEPVTVPDVVGKRSAAARQAIEAAGLVYAEQKYLGGVFDLVRFQDTEAGSTVRKGSTVTVTIW